MSTGTTKGPFMGASTVLATAFRGTVAANASNLEIFQIDLPADEDWYVTRVAAYCSNQGNGGSVNPKGGGVALLAAAITLVTADSIESAPTTDAGESAGKRVAAGTSLTVEASDGATTAIADLVVTIEGFKRKIGVPR